MIPSLKILANFMDVDGLEPYFDNSKALFTQRDKIKEILSQHIKQRPTADWLEVFQCADIWCAEVLDWPSMMRTEAYRKLNFEQILSREGMTSLKTPRSPLRFNGQVLTSSVAAPNLGQHTEQVFSELPP